MKRLYLLTLCLFLTVTSTSNAQTSRWRGEWLGRFPERQVRIFLRIDTSGPKGMDHTVTWASPNQGMPIQSVATSRFVGDSIHLTYTVPIASFDGKLDSKGDIIEGTWKQAGSATMLTLYRAHDYNAPMVIPAAGRADTLHLTLAITANAGERYATLYSPDQTEQLVPASQVYDSAGLFHIRFPMIHARFDGKYTADRSHLDGIFNQLGDYPMSFVRSELPIWTGKTDPIFTLSNAAVKDTNFEGTIKETFIYPTTRTSVPRYSWYKGENILLRMGDLSNETNQRVTRINLRTHRISESIYGSRAHARQFTNAPSDSLQTVAKEVLRATGRTHTIRGKLCQEYYSVDTDRVEHTTNLWWLTADYPQSVKNAILGPLLMYNHSGSGLAAILRMQQLNMVPIEYQVVGDSGIVLIATTDEIKPEPVAAEVFAK
jgi:hypothetical protein